jgi:hypothetical protein
MELNTAVREGFELVSSSIDQLTGVIAQAIGPSILDPEPLPDPLSADIIAILAAGKHFTLGTNTDGEAYIRLMAFDGTGAKLYQGNLEKIVARVRKETER